MGHFISCLKAVDEPTEDKIAIITDNSLNAQYSDGIENYQYYLIKYYEEFKKVLLNIPTINNKDTRNAIILGIKLEIDLLRSQVKLTKSKVDSFVSLNTYNQESLILRSLYNIQLYNDELIENCRNSKEMFT